MTATFHKPNNNEMKNLSLRPDGMFSNVNEVVEQLRLANNGGYKFQIDWSSSCYRDQARPEDPWSYYFAPCFPELPAKSELCEELLGGVPVACSRDNIITPRELDGVCNPLLLPKDRHGAHELIAKHLHLKPELLANVDAFVDAHFRDQMIGLHLRGAGRTDGGALELRAQYNTQTGIPFEAYFIEVDRQLVEHPKAGIFLCSDSSFVIRTVQERYGDRICIWPAQRSEFGEMHANHPKNAGQLFSPYRLGLDIVSEAWLLSRTDIFVHGNSNVANFVLCKSPDLIHAYVQA